MTTPTPTADYPVRFTIEPETGPRNKMTVGFRWLLGFPHVVMVGGAMVAGAGLQEHVLGAGAWGVLGAAALFSMVICWFAILFDKGHPRGLFDLCLYYLRWRVRALAYTSMFRDEYPPFGEGPYAASVEVEYPEGPRSKASVGWRPITVIPHLIALFFLWIAWFVTSVIAWFAILFTGKYPEGLQTFGIGVMRWSVRVEAYALLMTDVYPPFSLE